MAMLPHECCRFIPSCLAWLSCSSDITLRITFAEPASVPRIVRLEHAPTATAAFERLGDIHLQPKSLHQLRHLFRLGRGLEVQRFLRITLLGHMAEDNSGATLALGAVEAWGCLLCPAACW